MEDPSRPAFRTPDGRLVRPVTAEEMREVDRVAVEAVGVSLLMMMEHAGRSLADPLRGYDGRVVVLGPDPGGLEGAAARQFGVLEAMGVSPAPDESVESADLVLDALVGYGLSGPLRGRTAALVDRLDDAAPGVRSLDVPSGVDATTGERPGPSVDADLTTTLALPKNGLADIGLPSVVFERAGVEYEWPYGDGVSVDLDVEGG